MELVTLAHKIALVFASGENTDAVVAALTALLPSASYVRLCVRGSATTAVATSNLVARGFMTQSLLATNRCPCIITGSPQLVSASRTTGFIPLDGRLSASRFLCIPIPTMPDAPLADGEQISGLVESAGACIGTLVVGLAQERPHDPGLISNTSNLVRALAAELPGVAVRAAQDIVACILPLPLPLDAKAAEAAPSGASGDAAVEGALAAAPAATAAMLQLQAEAMPLKLEASAGDEGARPGRAAEGTRVPVGDAPHGDGAAEGTAGASTAAAQPSPAAGDSARNDELTDDLSLLAVGQQDAAGPLASASPEPAE